jgi:hypothetical protein
MSGKDLVPVTGVVHLQTALGILLDLNDRRIFIPGNCISTPFRRFAPGESVALEVLRSFAEQENLVAK